MNNYYKTFGRVNIPILMINLMFFFKYYNNRNV